MGTTTARARRLRLCEFILRVSVLRDNLGYSAAQTENLMAGHGDGSLPTHKKHNDSDNDGDDDEGKRKGDGGEEKKKKVKARNILDVGMCGDEEEERGRGRGRGRGRERGRLEWPWMRYWGRKRKPWLMRWLNVSLLLPQSADLRGAISFEYFEIDGDDNSENEKR